MISNSLKTQVDSRMIVKQVVSERSLCPLQLNPDANPNSCFEHQLSAAIDFHLCRAIATADSQGTAIRQLGFFRHRCEPLLS